MEAPLTGQALTVVTFDATDPDPDPDNDQHGYYLVVEWS